MWCDAPRRKKSHPLRVMTGTELSKDFAVFEVSLQGLHAERDDYTGGSRNEPLFSFQGDRTWQPTLTVTAFAIISEPEA